MPQENRPPRRRHQDRARRRPSDGGRTPAPATAFASGGSPDIPPNDLDPDALTVIHRLRSFGHQAFLVGGCVRDLLLGLEPKDFDVATSAHPGEIRATFRNCRLIGRRFRLAHVYFRGGKIIETATFRANPNGGSQGADLLITRDNVFGTAEEDARRRDFTINGLFYDVVLGKVLDYVGGKADLEARVLRTIGDPDVRIQEDPVRLLRAVRFAAKLDFEIEPETWDALVRYKGELARCAPARVLEETFRLLRSGHSEACFRLLLRLDALEILLPPLARYLDTLPAEEKEGFFTSLGLLDKVVQGGTLPDDSILLSSLLAHLAMDEGRLAQQEAAEEDDEPTEETEDETDEREEPQEPDEGTEAPIPWSVSAAATTVEELLRELSRSARLPRRISERANNLLRTMKVLSGARKRRGSPMRLVRQSHFPESLFLYWLWVHATGKDTQALDQWMDRAAQAGVDLPWLPLEPGEPEAVAPASEAQGDEERPEEASRGGRSRRKKRAPSAQAAETETETEAEAPSDEEREPKRGSRGEPRAAAGSKAETLPPEKDRRPPPGPANFLPF